MFNIKKQLLLIGLFMAARCIVAGQSDYCGAVIPSSSSAAFIYIYQGTPIELNGEALEYGSNIIAVFLDSNGDWQCAGQAQWWGYNTILSVRGEDSEIEGYDEGETFRFYVQLPNDCVLQEVEAEFLVNTQFPAGNTFTQAGNSRLARLAATFDPMLQSTILADTCEASTGQVTIDNLSGVSVSGISWSDGQEGFTAIDLSEGLISAQISTEEGCTFSSSFEIPAAECPLLQCNATCNGFLEGDQGCLPFTATFTDNSLSDAGIQSYFWDFGDGNTSTEASPTHVYTTPGTYTVTYTIADHYRTDSQSFEVVVYATPTAAWSYESDICQPQIITLSSASNDNIASWDWSFSDGQSANTSSVTLDFVSNSFFIDGTLEITDENGCSQQIALAIDVPEAYDLEIVPETIQMPNCMEANGNISITQSGGSMPFEYNWQHDAANNTNAASMLAPGDYSLTITDGNGCQDSLTVTLEDNTEVPMPDLGEDTAFCMNESITLDAGINGENFLWYANGINIDDANSRHTFLSKVAPMW
jgi:PKD repeat protein